MNANGRALSPKARHAPGRRAPCPVHRRRSAPRTVRAPVPMSAAAMRTMKLPSGSARTIACEGRRKAGKVAAATPVPMSSRPSRRTPGAGSRSDQPKRSAPSRKHAMRLRELQPGGRSRGRARARCGRATRSGRSRRRRRARRSRTRARTCPGARRGAHPRRGGHVERGQPMARAPVLGRVHHPRRKGGLLGEGGSPSRSARRRRGRVPRCDHRRAAPIRSRWIVGVR